MTDYFYNMENIKGILTGAVLIGLLVGVYYWRVQSGENAADLTINNNSATMNGENTKATIKTNFGNIELELFAKDAPKTVKNFLDLAKKGFYDGTKFHRVIPDFMIQGGDPNSRDDDWSNDGTGGPGYQFADEFNDHKLVRGTLAMANSGPDTNGSQFFIVTAPETPWLDGKHTAFGRVTSGMDVVTKIESLPRNSNDHPTTDAVILGIGIE